MGRPLFIAKTWTNRLCCSSRYVIVKEKNKKHEEVEEVKKYSKTEDPDLVASNDRMEEQEVVET